MNIASLLREVAARLDSIVGLREYGAALDGATDDLEALQRAASALASREVTLAVAGPCYASADVTLPAGAKVRFEGAGAFVGPGVVTYTPWVLPTTGGANPVLPGYTSATRPPADATWWRKMIAVKDPGLPETVQACIQTSSGGYTWTVVALAGS